MPCHQDTTTARQQVVGAFIDSQTSLDAVWDNAEDDVYAQLLEA
ncbi:hypothetical protein RYO59_000358 [Thermosynechococcaceae cyanobacterium Okahandja]